MCILRGFFFEVQKTENMFRAKTVRSEKNAVNAVAACVQTKGAEMEKKIITFVLTKQAVAKKIYIHPGSAVDVAGTVRTAT